MQAQGIEAIKEIMETKWQFRSIQHSTTKIDCHPTPEGVLIFVMGQVKTDDDPPHTFSQMFYLRRADDRYYLFNDIFRISLHDG